MIGIFILFVVIVVVSIVAYQFRSKSIEMEIKLSQQFEQIDSLKNELEDRERRAQLQYDKAKLVIDQTNQKIDSLKKLQLK